MTLFPLFGNTLEGVQGFLKILLEVNMDNIILPFGISLIRKTEYHRHTPVVFCNRESLYNILLK